MALALLGTQYVLGAVLIACIGLLLVRRFVPPDKVRPHHDVAGFMIAVIGVLYTVLLAFVVIVAWEQYEGAEAHAGQEAASLLAVYRVARVLPAPERLQLRQKLREYNESVIRDEWPAMADGHMSQKTQTASDMVWETVLTRPPVGALENSLLPDLVSDLNDMSKARNTRLQDSHNGVPVLMWIVLLFGGFATVAFTYFFDMENRISQMLMTILISAMIGLVLFLISAVDQPYSGDFKVRPEAMESAQKEMDQIEVEDRETSALRHAQPGKPGPPHTQPRAALRYRVIVPARPA